MEKAMKILFNEDSSTDFELIKRALRKSECNFQEKIVETRDDFTDSISNFAPDIILSDYSLPQFNGMEALEIRNKLAPMIPFILVTGPNNEEIAVESMKAGADDYILKDNLTRLGQAVTASIKKYKSLYEKKQIENILTESEQLFRTAFENAAIGVCMLDTNYSYINVNSAFCHMIGYEMEDILKLTFNDITHEEDKDIGLKVLEEIRTSKIATAVFEKRYYHKSGRIVWVNISIGKVHNLVKNSEYYVSYIQDITDRKESEIQLVIAKKHAEESDKLKTAFLNNISHEIRTPMNAIVGFSGLLKQTSQDSEKQNNFINIIIQSSKDLLAIINDIVNIAAIEANQEKIYKSNFNINAVLRMLYSQYLHEADKKQISFSYINSLPDDESILNTDEAKFIQVLSNLINNAIKFTASGFVRFGYSVHSDKFEFYIEDSGIGIDPENHTKIFSRFYQVENTTARKYGGTGLGLSIAKAYAELLGGTIRLVSSLGKGSIFYFSLPYVVAARPNSDVSSLYSKIKPNESGTKTILVVEDEEFNLKLLEALLTEFNFRVVKAVNGQEAIEIFKSDPTINLVLMDIKMPVMNGLEATIQIKKINPKMPVIAQTAYANNEEKERAIAIGCDDYIYKPIDHDELIQKITDKI